MRDVALALLGEPNKQLSRPDELRFGTKGAISVIPSKGVFFDNHDGHGGGVLQFVMEMGFKSKPEALDYLREFGLATEERRAVQVNGHDKPKRKIAATYDYVDEHGELLFQVVRYTDGEPRFMQRRPDPENADNWIWSTKGVRKIPYRMPDLQEALAHERPIWIVEGEKDVDNLARLGITATCNAGGAGKWPDDCTQALKGAHVVLCGDNDDPGRKHVERVAAAMQGIAASVTILALDGLPEKGDVSDWIALHPDNPADALQLEYLRQVRERGDAGNCESSRFGLVHFRDIHTLKRSRSYVVKNVIPGNAFGILYGDSQAGKSFLAIDIAMHIAMGREWFGHRVNTGGVLYVAGEGQAGIFDRFIAAHQALRAPDDLPIDIIPRQVDLWNVSGDTEPLIAEIKSQAAKLSAPLSLIVIDTHATASAGADENSAKDMTLLIQHYKQIQEATGATVIVVHHRNAEGSKMRGHTSLPAAADFSIEVTTDSETSIRRWQTMKQKDGPNGKKGYFDLMSIKLWIDEDGDPVTSCFIDRVTDEPAEKKISDAAAPKPGGRAAIALRQLQIALGQQFKEPPAELGVPAAITPAQWRNRFHGAAFEAGVAERSKDKAWERALKYLIDNGYVQFSPDQSYVWATQKGASCKF